MTGVRRWIGAVVAAVVMATLAACGGDSDDDPVVETPASTPTGGQPAGSSGYDYPG